MAVATKRYHFLDDVEFVEPLTIYEIEIGWLVDEIQDLAKDVANVAFKFVPRVCNLVAHKLSKLALLKPNCCIWLSEAPLELIALLSCDDYLSH
ncbi:hypothetical protein WN944_026699 [Citrus x changshan-huyou]|uniref:RNase H type-1 domain-containing protein n=1 Tax=Citrus x changshan-huyou TaxID=2935761 RepID=A0AAP0QDI0_9ROSI